MKFLDLFAGVGGFRSGLEMAGHECVGFVEWDKFARASYQAIYNTKGEYTENDITNVRAEELPRADIWTFGFPCQDISVAGKQSGFEGERSSLFFTVTGLIRQLKEEDRPTFLLIENVKNLLSVNGGWDFLKLQVELDEIGYDVEWDVLNSKEVVPQNRERVFIVGHFRGRRTRDVFPISGQSGTIVGEQAKINILGTTKIRQDSIGQREVVYGDGVVGALTATDYKQPKRTGVSSKNAILKVIEATKKGYAEAVEGDSVNLLHPNSKTRRGRVGKQRANTLETSLNQGVVTASIYDGLRIRKLTPLECWRLQGFSDWQFYAAKYLSKAKASRIVEGSLNHYDCKFTQKTSNSQLYKQVGNSVTVPVVYEIARKLEVEK